MIKLTCRRWMKSPNLLISKRFNGSTVENWDVPIIKTLSKSWNSDWDKQSEEWDGVEIGQVRHNSITLVQPANFVKTPDENKSVLTLIGKHQAVRTGKYLEKVKTQFTRFYFSESQEAIETAQLILPYLKYNQENFTFNTSELLQECKPVKSSPYLQETTASSRHFFEKGPLAEAAFRTFIARPLPPNVQSEEENTLLICHRSLISYFVLRTLQFPCEAWSRLRSANCSITIIKTSSSGLAFVTCVGDRKHLPKNLLSAG